MFHKSWLFLILVLTILLVTACSPVSKVSLTKTDNGTEVTVNKGGQIIVSLEGNPSTGYTWEAKDLDTTLLKQVGEASFTSSNPELIGSGGTITLSFIANQAGTATLTLVYHRPWETNVEPIDTFLVTVKVK